MGRRHNKSEYKRTHYNEYEKFSKAGDPIKPFEFENDNKNYDYFKVNNTKAGLYIYTNNHNSSISNLWYFIDRKYYLMQLRNSTQRTFEDNIEKFFNLAYVGKTEKGELEAIKKLIEPLVKKLETSKIV